MRESIIWLKPEKRFKYPHLSPADKKIWERYLATMPTSLGAVSYDLRVGIGQDPGETYQDNIRTMAVKLTQLRIDVLNKFNNSYQIIEVKFDPGPGAVGQLIAYRDLFVLEYPELRPVNLFLLCNKITPDLVTVCRMNNISFQVV